MQIRDPAGAVWGHSHTASLTTPRRRHTDPHPPTPNPRSAPVGVGRTAGARLVIPGRLAVASAPAAAGRGHRRPDARPRRLVGDHGVDAVVSACARATV